MRKKIKGIWGYFGSEDKPKSAKRKRKDNNSTNECNRLHGCPK